ncbi:hypothetical protein VTH8203_04558 [Vibrio thalassae]|uniref:Uncharacterized protein n=1 Tax=Vibrio thalassae TaxID=1243014 RepID=A0A240EQJ0_9VIBR|nr:hypothetical protein VTH8203_04558 [Vibrio thalassae]
MDNLSITTHLMAILTAFSAFTMPIALEVLNRCQRQFKIDPLIDVIAKVKLTHPRNYFVLSDRFSRTVGMVPAAFFPLNR